VEVAFSEQPHSHGLPRQYFLRAGLVPRFLAAAAEMNGRGWVLKVEDGYRTTAMQQGLGVNEGIFSAVLGKVQWECGGEKPPVDLLVRRLGSLVANAPKVGTHMSGSAMDISVLRRDTGAEVDRGGPYPEMSVRTPMASPFVAEHAGQNRREITALLEGHGFVAYPWEFWHYNDGDAYAELLRHTRRPARYGPVHMDPVDGSVTPIDDPCAPLNSMAVIQELMERVLAAQA
jgi:D-alanyl-D-alanine dipeptidase